jgi:DNA invertase Pin-like site-specific DNA recombinase
MLKPEQDVGVAVAHAVDRLSRDTTELLVIARDVQRAGAEVRLLAEPSHSRMIRPSFKMSCGLIRLELGKSSD